MSHSSRGFTLIELLLYVTIVGGLLLTISAFFALAVDARIKNQSMSEVNQQGMFAMDTMTQTIRNANLTVLPLPTMSASSLTLTVPDATLTPTTFNLSGTTLMMTEGLNAATSLTSDGVQVSGLNFTNLMRVGTYGIVRISFTVSRTNTTGRSQYNYQKTFIGSAEIGP